VQKAPNLTVTGRADVWLLSQVLPAAHAIGAVDPSAHTVIKLLDIADFGTVHVHIGGEGLDPREARVLVALGEPKRQFDVSKRNLETSRWAGGGGEPPGGGPGDRWRASPGPVLPNSCSR
jgi:hypothetical protein